MKIVFNVPKFPQSLSFEASPDNVEGVGVCVEVGISAVVGGLLGFK